MSHHYHIHIYIYTTTPTVPYNHYYTTPAMAPPKWVNSLNVCYIIEYLNSKALSLNIAILYTWSYQSTKYALDDSCRNVMLIKCWHAKDGNPTCKKSWRPCGKRFYIFIRLLLARKDNDNKPKAPFLWKIMMTLMSPFEQTRIYFSYIIVVWFKLSCRTLQIVSYGLTYDQYN